MYFKQHTLSGAVLLACGTLSSQLGAALPDDAVLNFTVAVCDPGYGCSDPNSGSWFSMDVNPPLSKITAAERTGISSFQGLRIRSLPSSTAPTPYLLNSLDVMP